MLNADRSPHSTICQNESTFNIPDWVAGEARAKIKVAITLRVMNAKSRIFRPASLGE